MAANLETPLTSKLKDGSTAASTRVYPQLNTQEPTFEQIVYTIEAADGVASLTRGGSRLKRYSVRLDCYAETENEAVALAKQVKDLLTPEASTPWVDSAAGVQGTFFEDEVSDFTEDGLRVKSLRFAVWFIPT